MYYKGLLGNRAYVDRESLNKNARLTIEEAIEKITGVSEVFGVQNTEKEAWVLVSSGEPGFYNWVYTPMNNVRLCFIIEEGMAKQIDKSDFPIYVTLTGTFVLWYKRIDL